MSLGEAPLLSLLPSGGPAPATATTTALAGDVNGDGTLSEFEKQILTQNAPKDYTMGDGTVVSIDPTQPLPAAVVAEVRASAATGLSESLHRATVSSRTMDIKAAVDAAAASTGKKLVFMYPGTGVNENGTRSISWGTWLLGSFHRPPGSSEQ